MKYRPERIEDVWGNEHVKTIWEGFKRKGNYPHSIVLCGSYGQGKTTLARIFANDITGNNRPLSNGLFGNIYELDATKSSCDEIRRLLSRLTDYVREPVVVFIDEKGLVSRAYVEHSDPQGIFDEAALQAVKTARFKPAQQRDRAVGVWMKIPISFKLK